MTNLKLFSQKTYTTHEVAKRAKVDPKTVQRWCDTGKVPPPHRDRNGWRVFTDHDLEAVLDYAFKVIPPTDWRPSARRTP